MQDSFKEYQKRINSILDYIDQNLGSKLSVEILANIACFSPYHFHRIFHSMVGENINSYVKRMRLSRAAQKLLYNPRLSITDIALECGFSSHSDFSRAFKGFYKMSPSEFAAAKAKMTVYLSARDGNERPYLPGNKYEEIYEKNIKVLMLPDFKVAYIRMKGLSQELKSREIEYAYSRLLKWAKARDLTDSSTRILGITLDSPEIVPIQNCRYDACITIAEVMEPEGEVGIRTVNSKGKYVSYTFQRNSTDLGEGFFRAMDYLYGFWMPGNGYIPEDKPFIEIHYTESQNEIVTDFCIPIKPL